MNEQAMQSVGQPGSSTPSRYDTAPFLVDKAWPLHWQLVVALVGGIVPAAVLAGINTERLGLPASRKLLCYAIALVGLGLMVMMAYQRTLDVPLLLPGQKFRAVQLSGVLVGGAGWLLLALLQFPTLQKYRQEGKAFGNMWAPGLMSVLIFGLPQRLLVWGIVLALTA